MKAVVTFVTILSCLAFVGCGKVESQKLPGSWQLTRQEAQLKSKTGETKSEREVPADEGFTYVFEQGSLYVPPTDKGVTAYQASYRLDGSKLNVEGTDGTAYQFEIKELSDDTLKLEKKSEEGDIESRVILTFKRIGVYSPQATDGYPQQMPQSQSGQGQPQVKQKPKYQPPTQRFN